jgi:hypothetical protein
MENNQFTDSIPYVNSLFQQPWWLDAVSPGQWDEIVIKRGEDIALRFPYVIERRNGFTSLTMPSVTQTLGPWLIPLKGKHSSQLSLQKELMTELIQRLPSHDSFYQRFHHSITNWLPFYWKGFTQTTRYTYVIEDLSTLDRVWDEMKSNIRNKIRKAEKSGVRVVDTDDIETFLDLNELTFKRQRLPLPFSRDFIRRINSACVKKNARKIYITYGPDGRPQTGLFCVYDGHAMYNLLQGGDPELRNSGANALAMWESIKFASKVSTVYDFEGSMIEPIEEFFRSFGAIQKPYFEISKKNSRRLKIRMHSRELLKILLGK